MAGDPERVERAIPPAVEEALDAHRAWKRKRKEGSAWHRPGRSKEDVPEDANRAEDL